MTIAKFGFRLTWRSWKSLSCRRQNSSANVSLCGLHYSQRGLSRSPGLSEPSGGLWSYAHGASDVGLLGMTIGKMMELSAAKYGSQDAFVSVHQDVRLSHQQLLQQCDRLASGLLALGLQPGDRVGIWAPNCIEWVLVQYAAHRAGLILVNVNPGYRVSELEFALHKVGMKAIIAAESFKSSDYHKMLSEMIPELHESDPRKIKSSNLPTLQNVIIITERILPGVFRFSDVMDMGDRESNDKLLDLQDKLQFDDPINIQFTSGTTGKPKGATLTHHNILNNARYVAHRMNYDQSSRLCVPVPLYHCFGMVVGGLAAMTCGATVVLPAPSFQAKATIEAVVKERCTSLYGTPTMFIDLLGIPELPSYDLTAMHTGIMTGSPCPEQVMKEVRDTLHMPDVRICYGTTETSPVAFQTKADTSVEKRVSTVGVIHPQIEAKIVDDAGCLVPRGVTGELYLRGYSVMVGYWEDPEKTKEDLGADGWYKTGDLTIMDSEGFLQIVGRRKEMLIRGGENIFPAEIEEFLHTCPKISDVQVFGVHDPRLGEEVCAWIKLKDGQRATEEEIKAFCKDKIAHFKVPRYIKFVDEYPMTVTGKVQKFLMKKAAEEELGMAKD